MIYPQETFVMKQQYRISLNVQKVDLFDALLENVLAKNVALGYQFNKNKEIQLRHLVVVKIYLFPSYFFTLKLFSFSLQITGLSI